MTKDVKSYWIYSHKILESVARRLFFKKFFKKNQLPVLTAKPVVVLLAGFTHG